MRPNGCAVPCQVRLLVPSSAEFNVEDCPLDLEADENAGSQPEGSKVSSFKAASVAAMHGSMHLIQ